MSVHDAQPGDIYVDENDTLWEVVTTCHEPTVCVRRVTSEIDHRSGGVSGLMWNGFRRIHRPKVKEAPSAGSELVARFGRGR